MNRVKIDPALQWDIPTSGMHVISCQEIIVVWIRKDTQWINCSATLVELIIVDTLLIKSYRYFVFFNNFTFAGVFVKKCSRDDIRASF